MIARVRPAVVHGRVRPPGSKSYTHRALAIGFVGPTTVRILGALDSDDTRATARGLERLGARVRTGRRHWTVRPPTEPRDRRITVDCRESGTTLRLLTALAAIGPGPVRFVGRGRLPVRPMDPLLEALVRLGARVRRERADRSLPFTIEGPIAPGSVTTDAKDSSQPISALLIALAHFSGLSTVQLRGPIVSRPYIDATAHALRSRGVRVDESERRLRVTGPVPARRDALRVPADASSAAYAWAAAAISGGTIEVTGLDLDAPQADLAILSTLERMGSRVRRSPSSVRVTGRATNPISLDLTDAPDLFPLVGALAASIDGPASHLRGAAHVAHKESDRLAETERLARALGARVVRRPGELRIQGGRATRALHVRNWSDHRLVMSAAVAALGANGPSEIGDARAVRKSYPGFWTMLRSVSSPRSRL